MRFCIGTWNSYNMGRNVVERVAAHEKSERNAVRTLLLWSATPANENESTGGYAMSRNTHTAFHMLLFPRYFALCCFPVPGRQALEQLPWNHGMRRNRVVCAFVRRVFGQRFHLFFCRPTSKICTVLLYRARRTNDTRAKARPTCHCCACSRRFYL